MILCIHTTPKQCRELADWWYEGLGSTQEVAEELVVPHTLDVPEGVLAVGARCSAGQVLLKAPLVSGNPAYTFLSELPSISAHVAPAGSGLASAPLDEHGPEIPHAQPDQIPAHDFLVGVLAMLHPREGILRQGEAAQGNVLCVDASAGPSLYEEGVQHDLPISEQRFHTGYLPQDRVRRWTASVVLI